MTTKHNSARQRVLEQALRARTLPEIEAATDELHQWVSAHPDDLGIVDAFEQLSLMEDIAYEQESGETHMLSHTPSKAARS